MPRILRRTVLRYADNNMDAALRHLQRLAPDVEQIAATPAGDEWLRAVLIGAVELEHF